jgi:hypothetical protein
MGTVLGALKGVYFEGFIRKGKVKLSEKKQTKNVKLYFYLCPLNFTFPLPTHKPLVCLFLWSTLSFLWPVRLGGTAGMGTVLGALKGVYFEGFIRKGKVKLSERNKQTFKETNKPS